MCSDRFPVHFTNTQRSFAVYEILQTTPFGRTDKGEVGIDRLIRDGVFQAAYPLHEGDYKYAPDEPQTPLMENNPRRVLYDTWARYRLFYKAQPLDLIRDYFGEKVSLYFAWLGKILANQCCSHCPLSVGLYTTWLLPASLVGVLVFLFGFIYLANNVPAQDVCTIGRNITMCPICDVVSWCWFVLLILCTHRHSVSILVLIRYLFLRSSWRLFRSPRDRFLCHFHVLLG